MRMRRMREPEPGPAPELPSTTATYLDQGCELVGELRFGDSVRIDGHVEGDIRAARQVVVGEAAEIRARIEAESVVVHGSVEGDIRARGKIVLHKTARVTGEIHTAGIVVEEGARLQGCILIGDEAPAAAPARPASVGVAAAAPDESERSDR